MEAKGKIWCDEDEHRLFEYYADFNAWLDSEEAAGVCEIYGVDSVSTPSKAFYAGDREAYEQAFREYRENRRNEVLNKDFIRQQFTDEHWFDRNVQRFDQLVDRLKDGDVVPFVGAGLSVSGGFPTWSGHLRSQGRTAGIDRNHVEALIGAGQYEAVIAEIEAIRGRDVFIQELRDIFSRTGEITNTTLLITELFTDTVVTTNYDRLIEQAFDTGARNAFQVITGTDALEEPDIDRVSIVKLHGDIRVPGRCIIGRNQYDQAYGNNEVDMAKPIPKRLEYQYKNSSLLFLGCSLNNDRIVQVLRAAKRRLGDIVIPQHFAIEQAPEVEQDLVIRNEYLLRLGITGIWFEKGQFECVEAMLRLARDEVRYRRVPHSSADRQEAPASAVVARRPRLLEFVRRLLFG